MKIVDLKTFVETKLLSKSDKALEKIGQEEQQKPLGQVSVGSRRMLNVCILLPITFFQLWTSSIISYFIYVTLWAISSKFRYFENGS